MCNRKTLGPKMKRWGTVALTRYYWKEFLPRTPQSSLLLKKDNMMTNTGPGIPYVLNVWRRPACHTMTIALDISSVIALIAFHLLINSVILSNTTVIKSTVDQKYLKPYWKLQQGPHFSRWSTSLLFAIKTLLITERRLRG